MSPYASRQSTGKMTNRPHFAHIQGGLGTLVNNWTTGVPVNGNERRKFRVVLRLHLLHPRISRAASGGSLQGGASFKGEKAHFAA